MYTSYWTLTETSSYPEPWGGDSIAVDVQFRHMRESRAVVHTANQMAEKLLKYHLAGAASCMVVIDEAHHRREKGIFEVTAKLNIPGERLYVARCTGDDLMREDLHAAVVDAFEGLEHQLAKTHGRRSWKREYPVEEDAA